MNIEYDSVPVYGDNDKCIKTKIRMYEDRVNTNFQGKKVPKENASYKYLLIMLDFVIRVNEKYYQQTLLEECKYVIRKNRMANLTNDDLDLSSSDESDNESDNESDSESDSETCYDICFYRLLFLYFFPLQINLYIYFLLSLLIILCYCHNNLVPLIFYIS